MAQWTKERVAKLSNRQIESLRENAERFTQREIINLCVEELSGRRARDDRIAQYVSEFHFVCPREVGITRNNDGTIWTETWVVAETHANRAVMYASLVSLHSSRAERSYLQGKIKAWRKSPRRRRHVDQQGTSYKNGIDFLFEPSDLPLPWKGNATGEKGYAWAPVPEQA